MISLSKLFILATATAFALSPAFANANAPTKISHVSRKPASVAVKTIATPVVSAEDEAMIKALPLRTKIGQMLFLGFTGTAIGENLDATITSLKPGGLVLFGRNIKTAPQVAELTRDSQNLSQKSSGLPLLIGVDQEGGNVLRIKTTFPLPSALAFGSAGDAKLVERAGQATGKLLRTLGFNMDLAPVLDVGDPTAARFIGTRTYGSSPALVSKLGTSFSQGLQAEKILPTTKHFPGHGGVEEDSHISLPERRATLAQMEKHDLVPFETLQKSIERPWAVMLAHVSYPDLDPSGAPASFSKAIVTGILRNRIGFRGVVITDDIQMAGAGLIEDVRERAVRAVEAGVDMIMITWNRKTQAAVSQAIYRAVKSGRIKEERLNESLRRIVAAKREYAPSEKKVSIDQIRLALKSPEFQSVADEAVASVFNRARTKEEQSYIEYAQGRPIILFSANRTFAKNFKDATADRSVRTYALSSQQTFNIDKVMRSNPEATGVFYLTGSQIGKFASRIGEDVAARMLLVTVEPPGILKNADSFRHIADIYYRHPQLGKLVADRFFNGTEPLRNVASSTPASAKSGLKKKALKSQGI